MKVIIYIYMYSNNITIILILIILVFLNITNYLKSNPKYTPSEVVEEIRQEIYK